jgi:hypothetical protein
MMNNCVHTMLMKTGFSDSGISLHARPEEKKKKEKKKVDKNIYLLFTIKPPQMSLRKRKSKTKQNSRRLNINSINKMEFNQ